MPFLLLWIAGAAIMLAACDPTALRTPEGQCEAAKDAQIVAESEGLDADMLRRAELAVTLLCPAEEG